MSIRPILGNNYNPTFSSNGNSVKRLMTTLLSGKQPKKIPPWLDLIKPKASEPPIRTLLDFGGERYALSLDLNGKIVCEKILKTPQPQPFRSLRAIDIIL